MVRERKERIDTRAERETLGDTPFAALEGLRPDLPASAPEATQPDAPRQTAAPYTVGKTRKGGYALSIEKRGGGKCVTLLGNVQGDAGALLQILKRHCGAGGTVRDDAVEIQGDHRQAIEKYLRTHHP